MAKNILVTGSSKGLGLVITTRLLAEGYSVISINRTISEPLAELSKTYSDRLRILLFDLENPDKLNSFFKDNISFDTPLHGFVNNAAIAYDDLVTNLRIESLEQMFRVNVFSPMILTKLVIRHMLFHKIEGSLVHLSSVSVHTGYKGLAMYASTKGALEAFSKNTAREWGERGIRSNCVVAGFMETAMSAGLQPGQLNRIFARNALKKPVSLESVADTASFLIGEGSSSITAQNIFVDNGTI